MDINTLTVKFPHADYISQHEASRARGYIELTAAQGQLISGGLRYKTKTLTRISKWEVKTEPRGGQWQPRERSRHVRYTVYQLTVHADDIVRSPKATKRMRQLAFDALAQMLPTA